MKILITGYSGSGKSTLCRKLQERYELPSLHLDAVQFLPAWKTRAKTEQQRVVQAFLDEHPDGWVIDGNYKALSYERRCEEADVIIQMLFGRLDCLSRCLRRYRIYKGSNRLDMTEGCDEKIDWEFIRWILWDGRKREKRDLFRLTRECYPNKAIVNRNQRDLDSYLRTLLRSHPKSTFGGVCRASFVDLGWERPRQELNLKRKDSGMNPES